SRSVTKSYKVHHPPTPPTHESLNQWRAAHNDRVQYSKSLGSISSVAESSHHLPHLPLPLPLPLSETHEEDKPENDMGMQRWSCNICKADFDSLIDQRSHFKSDFHRFNVKLSVAGKDTIAEEDFGETLSESLCKDYDISSISGSDDEYDKDNVKAVHRGSVRNVKNKLFLQLQNGDRVWVYRSLLMGDSESVSFDNDKSTDKDDGGNILRETEVIRRLNNLIHESGDNSKLRVVLLLRGGHFAGCVFEGNTVVAHKTFHRYVVRAKAGKKQSSKDASGRSIHSAGAALRRYNEFALKKDIEELFAAWKPYFSSSSSIFIYAPSSNRQLFFDGEKSYFVCQHHAIRNIPLTVRRPTYKEARRIYNILTQVSYDIEEESTTTSKVVSQNISLESDESLQSTRMVMKEDTDGKGSVKHVSGDEKLQTEDVHASSESGSDRDQSGVSTDLHEAAKSGDAQKVLELLENDLDPCALDERGRTPYMLATEKEVRNTFRRFMASNLEKWDWHAAKVPSPLTKEMEESQAAKQAEKDAKKKARAKELKKIRKAKEKKAQLQSMHVVEAASTS
ncbi:hypothetical protein Leryth_019242, partial [Lithospermum erythrorhizon]